MTQMSVKIGRFMCDSATADDVRLESGHRHRKYSTDNYVTSNSSLRTNGANQLFTNNQTLSQCSLPDVNDCNFDSDVFLHLEEGKSGKVCVENEADRSAADGSDYVWPDDYSRTLRPEENAFILNLLRVVELENGNSLCANSEEDDAKEESCIPLPWRSNEATAVLEDSSKYLRDLEEFDGEEDDDDVEKAQMKNDIGDLHDSLQHSSSSSSFRNIPGFYVPRHDLSNCHSVSLSHWLSEAESRHSEPFGPHHHHVLNSPTSPINEPSLRSSGGLYNRHYQHDPSNKNHHSRSPSSSSRSSSPILIPDDDEELVMSRHDQVLKWLMTNELTENVHENDDEDDFTDRQMETERYDDQR